MLLGWENSIPSEIGGGPTDAEAIYEILRSSLGTLPGPENSAEDMPRQAKSLGLADAMASIERAVVQAFPNLATDFLATYEELLGIFPSTDATEVDRRAAVALAWTNKNFADVPSLRQAIQAVTTNADIIEPTEKYTTTVRFGKTMGPRPSDGSYGSVRNATGFPNYSTRMRVEIKYTPQAGEAVIDAELKAKLAERLNVLLPAWVDWSITTGGIAGFFCDGVNNSFLDFKAL